MTLRELKPSSYSAINVTVEYLGRRYLITHCNDWFTAERVACDYQAKFPDACYFTSSKYDSTHIDGKAIDFRNHYAKEKPALNKEESKESHGPSGPNVDKQYAWPDDVEDDCYHMEEIH